MNRKAVSPLIAVVLLIVFTVAVGTTVMTWMIDYTKTTTTAATESTSGDKGVVACSQEIIDISSVYASDGSIITKFSDGISSKDVFVEGGVGNSSATVTLPKTASITGASVMVSSMYDGSFDENYHYMSNNNNTGFTLNTGSEELNNLWDFSFTTNYHGSNPAVNNGVVYISADNKLYAFDELSGEVKWSYGLSTSSYTSPVVIDDIVYIGDNNANVTALYMNGTVKWNVDYPYWLRDGSSLVYDEGILYFSTTGALFSIYAENGTHIWNYTQSLDNYGKIAVTDNRILLISESGIGLIRAFNKQGVSLWNYTDCEYGASSPVVYNDYVFAADECGEGLHAVNLTDGTQIWNSSTAIQYGDIYYVNPVVFDDVIYIGTYDQGVVALNLLDGSLIWNSTTSVDFGRSTPVLSNNKLYILSYSPVTLYVLNMTDGAQIENKILSGNSWVFASVAIADNLVFAPTGSTSKKINALGDYQIPSSIQIDAGANDADKWAMTGKFNTTALTRIANITTAIKNYLSTCGTDLCVVPLEIEGTSNGTVKMYGLNITAGIPIIKANIANNGNADLEIKKVFAYAVDGSVCELTPGNTLLEVGDMTQAESSSCSFSCSDLLSVKVSTTCGMGDEYTAEIECS